MEAGIERTISSPRDVQCPICGNQTLRMLPDGWCETPMVYCGSCPVVFQPPTRNLARQAFDQYRTGAYWQRQSRVSRVLEAALLSWRLRAATSRLRELEGTLGRTLLPGERVLDVGCGPGEVMLLARTRRSCAVVGIEPASHEAMLTRTRCDLDVVSADPAMLPSGGRFDVILALHVIERVASPLRVVRELLGALAPGGRLVVERPNLYRPAGGMPIRRFPDRAHVWTFSLPSLVNVIEQAGGRIVFKCDDGFLRLVSASSADLNPSIGEPSANSTASVGQQVASDRHQPDAWVTLERYQASYLWSMARIRWWWMRALFARHVIPIVAQSLVEVGYGLRLAKVGA